MGRSISYSFNVRQNIFICSVFLYVKENQCIFCARATQKGDVLILLDKAFNKEGFTAAVLKLNRRGLKLAVSVLPEEEASKLEELSHLKVGMTYY